MSEENRNQKPKRNFFTWLYSRDGKGVKKSDVIKDYNFKNFFKLLGRKWQNIVKINLLYIVGNFPIFFLIFAASGNFSIQSMLPVSEMYPIYHGMATAGGAGELLMPFYGVHGLMESYPVPLEVDNLIVKIFFGIACLFVITFGLVNAACAYIMRNMVKCEPVFWSIDFFGTIKKNWKMAVPMGILDLIVLGLNAYAIYYYWFFYQTGINHIMFFCSLVTLVLYLFMRFYMYMIMVTFKMNFFKVLKNSFIFAILCAGKNFLALIGIAVVVLLTLCFAALYTPIGVILLIVLVFGLCTFISTYVAYPQMKKYMIDPYYSDTAEEPEEEDGDNYYEDKDPTRGKPGGYGEDEGEYYDAGEYVTDENEYKPDDYKKNK
ncbi:MAG: hypothetical protein IJW21_07120 [Clostridia bacterium]|nr:hypothetical protein [Clostridia bacterium]